jgi:hypothetical protein
MKKKKKCGESGVTCVIQSAYPTQCICCKYKFNFVKEKITYLFVNSSLFISYHETNTFEKL